MNEKLRLIRKLLQSQTTLVLATVDGAGQPRSTPLFFVAGEGLQLYWFSARTSQHGRNCARQPRASVAIFRNARQWQQIRGVQMEGVVGGVRERNLRVALTAAFRKRFGLDDSFAPVVARSTLYRFTPQWVRYLDNSRGFGYRFEMSLANPPAGLQ